MIVAPAFAADQDPAQAAVPTAPAASAPGLPAQAADQAGQVQEVIVTAQKRSEPLEKVPVAVQVVQGQSLRNQNFNDLQDLGQVIPDVHVVNTGSFGDSLNIRGIGSGAGNPAFDQSVATFVDDLYFGRSRSIQASFLDVDRIEVLKGPQSTFFGNNAIAGALNIISKKPDNDFDGYIRALYGSFDTYAVEGAVGTPINDKLGVRIAGTVNGDTGWIRNVDTGKLSPGQQNYAGRFTAVYKPIANFDATLKLEGSSDRITGATSNTPGQITHCPPQGPLTTNALNNFCGFALAQNAPRGLDNNLNAGLPGQFAKIQSYDGELTLNYHLRGLTLTSVTGYTGYKFTAQEDNASSGPIVESANSTSPERYHQFSQEVRVTSPSNQPIEYLAGAYYQDDELNYLLNGDASYLTSSFPAYARAGLFTPAQLAALTPTLPLGYDVGFAQHEEVASVFGAASWNATDKLKFNGGVRGTSVHKAFTGEITYGQETQTYGGLIPDSQSVQNSLGFLLGPPGSYSYSRTDSAILGSAGVQYQLLRQAMAYFSYNHGFKAGGFNAISPSPIGGLSTPTFGPEHVDSYEIGFKSKWLANRLLFNLDVFREDYSDLQVNALVQLPVNSTIAVENAASSRSQGVEVESQLVVTKAFSLTVDVTYLDARYTSFPNASPTFLERQLRITSQNLTGRPLDFATKWSGTIGAQYRLDLPRGYRLTTNVSPFLQSSYYNSNGTDDPNDLIHGTIRLDGRLTLDSPDRRWALDVIGKNLTDAVIPVSYGTNNVPGGKEEPLNVSGQIRYTW